MCSSGVGERCREAGTDGWIGRPSPNNGCGFQQSLGVAGLGLAWRDDFSCVRERELWRRDRERLVHIAVRMCVSAVERHIENARRESATRNSVTLRLYSLAYKVCKAGSSTRLFVVCGQVGCFINKIGARAQAARETR